MRGVSSVNELWKSDTIKRPRASNATRSLRRPHEGTIISHRANDRGTSIENTSSKVDKPPSRRLQNRSRVVVRSDFETGGLESLDLRDFELKEDGTLGTNSFSEIGVTPSLCQALNNNGISNPTLVQSRSLPLTFLTKHHCMIRSETGSGKSLVFLLPALQERLPGLSSLIVVPTRELAVQLYHNASKLNSDLRDNRRKRMMAMYTGVNSDEELLEMYVSLKPHLLIATPKQLLKLLETNVKDFVNLRRLVLDEVDKLLLVSNKRAPKKQKLNREQHPRPCSVVLTKLLELKRRFKTQLIATSATLDVNVQEELVEMGWGEHSKIVSVSPKLSEADFFQSPSSIEHCYLECDDTSLGKSQEEQDKMDLFLDHFQFSKEKSTLVFIHRGAPIHQFLYQLRKRGLKAEALHENIGDPDLYQKFLGAFQRGDIEVVVATEETVRGLDFPWLNTVYLLEVPRTASEYLHLCGRVGRVKRRGQCVVVIENAVERRRLQMHHRKIGVKGACVSAF